MPVNLDSGDRQCGRNKMILYFEPTLTMLIYNDGFWILPLPPHQSNECRKQREQAREVAHETQYKCNYWNQLNSVWL